MRIANAEGYFAATGAGISRETARVMLGDGGAFSKCAAASERDFVVQFIWTGLLLYSGLGPRRRGQWRNWMICPKRGHERIAVVKADQHRILARRRLAENDGVTSFKARQYSGIVAADVVG